jgi:catechol 2,3-dioxygenase-like lactoylglutathione lyase family enzyme
VLETLDHIVLTITDIDTTTHFYVDILGLEEIRFDEGRRAVRCGRQKINLHVCGAEVSPHAGLPTPGSADLCFLTNRPLAELIDHLHQHDLDIELGPVERMGALGPIRSVYLRDPDKNLIEIANQIDDPTD